MGCVWNKLNTGPADMDSFDSIESAGSAEEDDIQRFLVQCREGIYHIERPQIPHKDFFKQAKFATSAAVFFNNIKQNPHTNPFQQSLDDHPDVYLKYFPYLRYVEQDCSLYSERDPGDNSCKLKEALYNALKTNAFQRHMTYTNRMINNILNIALTEDITTVAIYLKRLGARHAELGIPARYVAAFRVSFLTWVRELLEIDRELLKLWDAFIRFIVNNIVTGMNDHYRKILFVFWSVSPHHMCYCLPAPMPTKLAHVETGALLSLKNMAASVDSSLED